MKYLICLLLLISSIINLFGQKNEAFDLVSYTSPAGWTKATQASVVSYTITDNQKGTYCQIGVYASTTSKGGIQADFESEWQELIVRSYKPTTKPELVPAASGNGWAAQGGAAPFVFDGAQSVAMLVTMSGNGRCQSIVILTNTDVYQGEIGKFLESVDYKAVALPVSNNGETSTIYGTWNMTTSNQSNYNMKNGLMNSIVRQYTLNDNGTYTFITKTFDPQMNKLLLGKESGTFQISGNNLTIIPQKSVLEGWTKKDGTSQWGEFVSSQNIALEQVTYQFTKHYFSGIQEWNLVLQTQTPTKREGPFSNNTTFSNAYYYTPISANHPVIELPVTVIQETQKQTASARGIKGAFIFTTSNFDDGWTSTVQEDWVDVTKGGLKVLIHYPTSKIDVSSADYKTISNNAWNTLVAPRYSSLNDFFLFGGSADYERPHFIAGNVTDNSTGKRVYVALFKKGNSGWIEFITADKNSFVQAFGLDASKLDYYAASEVWNPLSKMADYNKFAVAAADLQGKWTNNFSGLTQYVNVYTGASAGAHSHTSTEIFQFKGNTYHWELVVASGMIGSIKADGVKSDGTLTIPNNWQIHFSNLEGKQKTYNAFFSCFKGGRTLWLEDSAYAIGYTGYGKAE